MEWKIFSEENFVTNGDKDCASFVHQPKSQILKSKLYEENFETEYAMEIMSG